MKFIVNRKIFDTDKSELVCRYTDFSNQSDYKEIELYITKKGSWYKLYTQSLICKNVSEDDVKQIFEDLDDIELYEKYFGKLEEA